MKEEDQQQYKPEKNTSLMPVIVIILVLIVGGAVFLLSNPTEKDGREDQAATNTPVSTVPDAWQTYTNQEFNFSVQLPPQGWKIVEAPQDQIAPKFNIYKEGTLPENVQPPLDHFVEADYVGIYPEGIPTEGVVGETATPTLAFREPTQNARMYHLDDDTPWAVFANFKDRPDSWGEPGFIWGRIVVDNLTVTCMRDGKEISQKKCEPLMGDALIRSGSVNADDWSTIKNIISSFRFVEEGTDNGTGTTTAN